MRLPTSAGFNDEYNGRNVRSKKRTSLETDVNDTRLTNRAAGLGQQRHSSQERRGSDNEQHEATLRDRVAIADDLG